MAAAISAETAGHELRGLLDRLHLGESLTLVDTSGRPVAVLISLRGDDEAAEEAMEWEAWKAEWDALAERIGKSWKSEKSAVQIVSEMRR